MISCEMRRRAIGILRGPRIGRFMPAAWSWRLALPDEVAFWDDWMATRGAAWPEGFVTRQDPELPLQEILRRHARVRDGREVAILDVASGPMTWVGKRWGDRRVAIDPVDILAPLYDRLLAKHGIEPLVRTRYGTIEGLSRHVASGRYDLVFCKNALDHSRDPMRGIREMLVAARPGGTVLLYHHRNEGCSTGFTQLHQWNFDAGPHDGFVISTRAGLRWDVRKELRGIASVSSDLVPGDREAGDIITAIRRLS